MSYTGHSLGRGYYPTTEKQSAYSTAPADWATGHSLWESYPAEKKQSVYSTAPADWEKNEKIVIDKIVFLRHPHKNK